MRIFGIEFEEKYILAFAAGNLFGGGFFYVAYKLLTRSKNVGRTFGKRINNNVVDCEADLMLPVNLENEYGNSRKVCFTADETASAFLKQLPQHFFQFQENFCQLITSTLSGKKCTRALVIGSKTGRLTFHLSKTFSQVKGIERSFSQVVTCLRFQNFDNCTYQFPLEGSLKTANSTISSPCLELAVQASPSKLKNKIKESDRLQFINCDPSKLPVYIGQFQLVIVNNCLNEIDDPQAFLTSLEKFVEHNGSLIISTDYNWNRMTNQETGFGGLPVTNSFELLQLFLKGHFTLVQEQHMPEAYCVSNRTCQVSNNHVTLWSRNIDGNADP